MAVLEAPDTRQRGEDRTGILWSVAARRDAKTARDVVLSVLGTIARDDSELVLLFCSPQFQITEIAAAVAEFGGAPQIVGCTTAGEITPFGYRQGTITGLSLPKAHFRVSCSCSSNWRNSIWPMASRPRAAFSRSMRRRNFTVRCQIHSPFC